MKKAMRELEERDFEGFVVSKFDSISCMVRLMG